VRRRDRGVQYPSIGYTERLAKAGVERSVGSVGDSYDNALRKAEAKTGLRLGELLALKWPDVDLVAGQFVVRRTFWRNQEGPPKGGRHRTVPLSDVAISTLKARRHL
jgi:integrase